MYLSSDGTYLIGLWFEGSKNPKSMKILKDKTVLIKKINKKYTDM